MAESNDGIPNERVLFHGKGKSISLYLNKRTVIIVLRLNNDTKQLLIHNNVFVHFTCALKVFLM